MRKKRKLAFMLALLFVLISSCKEDLIIEDSVKQTLKTTKSSNISQMDIFSDEYKHRVQSDVEGMLLDQIVYRDSVYVLNMTKEEADDLKIPDSLYVQYISIVNNLNVQK